MYLAVLFSLFRIMPALILFIVILHTGWKENRQGKAMMEGRREEGGGEGTEGMCVRIHGRDVPHHDQKNKQKNHE